MKQTGIQWISEIPKHWELAKVKHKFYISKEKAHQENPVVLKLARSGVQVRDISNNEGQLAESYENYNPILPGDLLLNPMDLYSGANCNMSEVSGVISPAYVNLRPLTQLNPKYFDYYFKCQYWAMAMFAHGKGISFDNRWTLNSEAVLNYYIPFPSFEEQNKIVNAINNMCANIDKVIKNQEAQIEKLKEYKRSIITEAVTKGLNSDVPMKDSGVEWIGNIPKSWGIKRAKFLADSFSKGSGITKEDIVVNGDSPCVRYGEIYTKYNGYFDECVTRTDISKVVSPQYFSYGDILFVCTGELVEEIGKNVVYIGQEKCLAGGDIIVMKHSQNPVFLSFALNSYISQCQKSCSKAKLKVVHISASDIGNVFVAIPSLEEQKLIADYLVEKCSSIDRTIEIKREKIDKLQEYKKSLIYEYVTGKKEVI